VAQRLDLMVRGMIGRGLDATTAKAAALKALAGTVARQGTMIAFEKTFMLTGFMMLTLLALVFFLRSKAHETAGQTGGQPGPSGVAE
jgi:hypothetical protein